MADVTLTEQEVLNFVDNWTNTWNTPGGTSEQLVNDVYADEPEVRAPLQALAFLKPGGSKRRFLEMEQRAEDAMKQRQMVIQKRVVQGCTAALEVEVPYVMNDGRTGSDWIAAFLTFAGKAGLSRTIHLCEIDPSALIQTRILTLEHPSNSDVYEKTLNPSRRIAYASLKPTNEATSETGLRCETTLFAGKSSSG